jgi:hypothetical protein
LRWDFDPTRCPGVDSYVFRGGGERLKNKGHKGNKGIEGEKGEKGDVVECDGLQAGGKKGEIQSIRYSEYPKYPDKYPGFTDQQWGNIKKEVVVSFEHIEDAIQIAIGNERNAEIFSDYLREVFVSLHIED